MSIRRIGGIKGRGNPKPNGTIGALGHWVERFVCGNGSLFTNTKNYSVQYRSPRWYLISNFSNMKMAVSLGFATALLRTIQKGMDNLQSACGDSRPSFTWYPAYFGDRNPGCGTLNRWCWRSRVGRSSHRFPLPQAIRWASGKDCNPVSSAPLIPGATGGRRSPRRSRDSMGEAFFPSPNNPTGNNPTTRWPPGTDPFSGARERIASRFR